jgi:LuxR family maltose regulon positive regulatory protein
MRIPTSRTTVPELPPGHAPRRRLLERLGRAGGERLVTLIAPAGYGKTVLLADWLRRCGDRRSAWVSVDPNDDVLRFRAALLAALTAVPDLPPDSPLREIGRPDRAATAVDFVDALSAALDATHPAVRLVLDDVHELVAPEALRDLARLVRRRPAGLRLVLASRVDPPLPLPRLRLEGRLHELRADALRFDRDETVELLRAAGSVVSPQQAAVLHTRTDGWVAGLRFAALALRSAADPDRFIAHFSGSDRAVADYLTGEVMAALPARTQWFLWVGAVCADLPAALAGELFDRPDAERVLDELVRGTALVQRTEPGTYRIHPLFRTYLVADLQRHQPGLLQRSHATAARWWLAAEDPVHALRHAQRAGDGALLTELLRHSGVALVATGRAAAVREALEAAGAAVAEDPWACLLSALVHHCSGAVAEAGIAVEHARRIRPADPGPALGALATGVELLVDGRRTGPGAAPGPVAPELEVLRQLGRAAAATGRCGDDPVVLRAGLDRAVSLARTHGFGYFEARALSRLAVLEAVLGDYRAMAAAATAAIRTTAAHGRDAGEWAGEACGLLAYRDLLDGEPAAARARAEEALGGGHPLPGLAELVLRAVRRTAEADLGEHAPEALAPDGPTAVPAPAPLLAALAALEHRVVLDRRGPLAAADTAVQLERRVGGVGEVLVMRARAHLLGGRYEVAASTVEPVRTGSVPPLVGDTRIEAHLVAAEAGLRAGDPRSGGAALAAALTLGASLGVVRPFATAGGQVGELLGSVAPPGVAPAFLRRIEEARSVLRACAPVRLSEREQAVLALLPSLLSAAEIADELTVSVNTVKSHIRSIYGKLGVSSRRAAVGHANQLSLLR